MPAFFFTAPSSWASSGGDAGPLRLAAQGAQRRLQQRRPQRIGQRQHVSFVGRGPGRGQGAHQQESKLGWLSC